MTNAILEAELIIAKQEFERKQAVLTQAVQYKYDFANEVKAYHDNYEKVTKSVTALEKALYAEMSKPIDAMFKEMESQIVSKMTQLLEESKDAKLRVESIKTQL